VSAYESIRSENDEQNDGQYYSVLGDVLTFVFIPQFSE